MTMDKPSRFKGLLAPLVVTLLLVGMFYSFLRHVDKRLDVVTKSINDSTAVVLSPNCDTAVLSKIIFTNNYVETKKDADFIAATLVSRQKEEGRLPSLFILQKRAFGQVPAVMAADSGVLLKRLDASREKLGQDAILTEGVIDTVSPYRNDSIRDGRIVVHVVKEDPASSRKKIPCESGIYVRLTIHFRDSLNQASSAVLGYACTDAKGVAVFDHLVTAASYSVLPVREGFEYGASKGTVDGKWKMDKSGDGMHFTFEQREHRIPLFSNATLSRIKADRTIMVRSPRNYKSTVIKWLILVMVAWWVLCLFVVVRKKKLNGALVASCMFLSVLSVLMMFSMQDPLNDELYGVTMGQGVVCGVAICILFQWVDFVKFYQNRYIVRFDPLHLIGLKRLPKGSGWLVMALLITALLWTPFGQSIGGMKVNLNLFGLKFQPSEIAKYLILFFMAAFFTQQADAIIAYSQPNRVKMMGNKIKTLLWMVVGLVVLMGMYLALGDMGPGLVIGITFILLYSLVKSKVDLEHQEEKDRWKRVFSCDFAMLVYGVVSFVALLLLGYMLGYPFLGALSWFLLFGLFCVVKKQLFESALMMNLVVSMFVFGGAALSYVDKDAGKRFEERVSMCSNTWGTIDIDHINPDDLTVAAEPVSNTQVANGLWALATGGFWGQGLGEGKPTLIPAFHTDMILSSIGEQLGWIGLLMVVIALAVLLRKMVVIGYRSGHPFAFYLCLGFAVVIGVQFFVIALGSSGMVPLTGVTVPFLSFGRVSMILNLAAFGIVLSLANSIQGDASAVSEHVRRKTVEQYSYPIAMITLTFLFFAVFTLSVWQYYQLWRRNSTLIHRAFVLNSQGAPDVKYNPRIDLIVRNMHAGNIYDRYGRLLATSDKKRIQDSIARFEGMGIERDKLENMLKLDQKRYYPFGEHLFFMVGDQNEGLYFSYNEDYPVGYMAEYQHLSYLRGFDNVLKDKERRPVKVRLATEGVKESIFLPSESAVSGEIQLRDYSCLLDYLKDGVDGKKVLKHNKEVVEEHRYDLHLTVDAALQVELQNKIAEYVASDPLLKKFNLMRISVVVLDAKKGDLLASANYPLPDYDRMREEEELARHNGKNYAVYSDNWKDSKWTTYTDRDLGTTRPTEPGSTAKIMSAMGGFRKRGIDAASITYRITNANAIERNKDGVPIEPTIDNPKSIHRHDPVRMYDAIVESSNCYFVSLVNDTANDLYDALKPVYSTVGISIGGITPYYYTFKSNTAWKQDYNAIIDANRREAIRKYRQFERDELINPKKENGKWVVKSKEEANMSVPEWKWAWGQSSEITVNGTRKSFSFQATPLDMARVASTVVNKGMMPVTQYLLPDPTNSYVTSLRKERSIRLIQATEADTLKYFMKKEAANQKARNGVDFPASVGGKTGTPERERDGSKKHINDGWYMFFVEGDKPIAVVVRMERLKNIAPDAKEKDKAGSGAAVKLTKDVILQCLEDNNYIVK